MTPTAADYAAAFDLERQQAYPVVDAFEAELGFAIERSRLEGAARVLACPVKKNPPNWQHGRVLYAAAREYVAGINHDALRSLGLSLQVLDIGTAKGFSALCLLWACRDAGVFCTVTSVDVIDPDGRVARNTVTEVDGLLTLKETLSPWPESDDIQFLESTGVNYLQSTAHQTHIAFIDGKHTGVVVKQEGRLLAGRQKTGDLAIFDDMHLPDIAAAVNGLSDVYELRRLDILPTRGYAIGRRR